MANRGAVCWESHLYGFGRGWSATLVWMIYCGTVGKPGGKQRKQTSFYSQGSLQPTHTAPKSPRCGSCIAMVTWRAELLSPGVRPEPFEKKRANAPKGRRGVRVQSIGPNWKAVKRRNNLCSIALELGTVNDRNTNVLGRVVLFRPSQKNSCN